MIESILELVPTYGLWLIFFVVLLACLAVPLPASVLVLTAGSFAAAEDLTLIDVLLVSGVAFVVGDQIAFLLARRVGPKLLHWLKKSKRIAPTVERSEALLDSRGGTAVFLSHTILSPTCPYISYLSGAGGLSWARFTSVAAPGALVWCFAYVFLGYFFASQLEQVAEILSQFFGVVLALCMGVGAFLLLRKRWIAAQKADVTV